MTIVSHPSSPSRVIAPMRVLCNLYRVPDETGSRRPQPGRFLPGRRFETREPVGSTIDMGPPSEGRARIGRVRKEYMTMRPPGPVCEPGIETGEGHSQGTTASQGPFTPIRDRWLAGRPLEQQEGTAVGAQSAAPGLQTTGRRWVNSLGCDRPTPGDLLRPSTSNVVGVLVPIRDLDD